MWPLVSTGSLERRSLASFPDYREDRQTAVAFERPFRHRVVIMVVAAFGGWAVAGLLVYLGKKEFVDRNGLYLIGYPFFGAWIFGLLHVAWLARQKPVSLRSGKEMKVYLQTDKPPGIYTQLLYVCDESRTYFTRTYLQAGNRTF